MSKASENYLAQSLLCLFKLKLRGCIHKKLCTSHYWEVSELPIIAGKLWHLFCFSSYFTPGYWLLPLSSKSMKSLFVVTVIPARCRRLHFDVRDSLQDLGVVKCNCTEPKTKWEIFFFFFYSFPPGPLGLFRLYWSWELQGLCGLVCVVNVILHWAVSLLLPCKWISHEEELRHARSMTKMVSKHAVSIEVACISS